MKSGGRIVDVAKLNAGDVVVSSAYSDVLSFRSECFDRVEAGGVSCGDDASGEADDVGEACMQIILKSNKLGY